MISVNKTITCTADTQNYSEDTASKFEIGRSFRDFILKMVIIHFSKGCGTNVYVRVKDNGGIFLPDPKITGIQGIFADGVALKFHVNKVVNAGDKFSVDYKNLDDDHAHTISVEYVFTKKGVNSDARLGNS